MNDASKATHDLAVLTLEFETPGVPDWPVLSIRVNGESPFAKVAKDWQGFDPGKMLGRPSPLIPDDAGHRVALYRCSCGEAGCGVIAPFVVASPDRKRISWVDFRDYVGVFTGPTAPMAADHDGKPWQLPDLHFDYAQYVAEVQRATADRSWETPRRKLARLLDERLTPMNLTLPPDLPLTWVTPAWKAEGVVLSFSGTSQQLLHLNSTQADPAQAAEDITHQLLSTSPHNWTHLYGYHP
ncbi:hypothetical protein OHA70_23510 [Kribbella sp. NBC_00382]|uniref:hypothetical protein n=1 Tax=Kribbella sp. NBC_00382 TaxID=2975967 RepID=UPI002E1F6877